MEGEGVLLGHHHLCACSSSMCMLSSSCPWAFVSEIGRDEAGGTYHCDSIKNNDIVVVRCLLATLLSATWHLQIVTG